MQMVLSVVTELASFFVKPATGIVLDLYSVNLQ